MRWLVVIPWIGPADLLDGCLRSMDKQECPDVPVLIVDNSADGGARTLKLPGLAVHRAPKNLGVAASWNLGLARDAEYTLLLSAAMRFDHGLSATLNLLDDVVCSFGAQTAHAFHAHVVGRECVRKVGTFDERFWPIEYEDTDYRRRMMLAGMGELPHAGQAHMTCVGGSIAGRMGYVPKSEGPRLHYVAKWGGEPGEETSQVPLV